MGWLSFFMFFLLLAFMNPSPCYADGMAPLLLMVNGLLFSVGQVWILSSEYLYLIFLFRKVEGIGIGRLLAWDVLMNLLSALVGALIFPILLALFPALVYLVTFGQLPDRISSLFNALGTWMGPGVWGTEGYMGIVVIATIVGFVVTYFITVYVEYFYLRSRLKKRGILFEKPLLLHVYGFNLISYLGLIALLFFTNTPK